MSPKVDAEDVVGGDGGPTPMFTKDTMPKVSPTVQCVISLAIQYFVIYTAPAIIRTMNEFSGNGYDVLFLGARMRAIQLSQGETKYYELRLREDVFDQRGRKRATRRQRRATNSEKGHFKVLPELRGQAPQTTYNNERRLRRTTTNNNDEDKGDLSSLSLS